MSIEFYILFYILLIVFSLLQLKIDKRLLFFEILFYSVFLLFIVFRGVDNTPDTIHYVREYESVKLAELYNNDNLNTFYNYEIGYSVLSQIVKYIFGDDYRFLFLIVLLIQFFSVKLAMKNFVVKYELKTLNPNLTYIPFFTLYVAMFGFMYNGVVLRAGIAICLFFLALSYLINKKYLLSIFLVFIAYNFHKSSLFGLIIWIPILLNFKLNKKTSCIILFSVLILYILRFHLIISGFISDYFVLFFQDTSEYNSMVFKSYLDNVQTDLQSYSVIVLFNFFLSFLIQKYRNEESKFYNVFSTINLLITCSSALLAAIPVISRVFDYYLLYNLLLIYCLFFDRNIKIHSSFRYAIIFTIVIVYAINFYRLALMRYN